MAKSSRSYINPGWVGNGFKRDSESGGGPPPPTWSPADLGSKTLWLDASDLSTITESAGDVSQWDDKHTLGYDFTQGTSAFQPTLENGGICFDGTDDFMAVGSFSPVGPITFFTMFKSLRDPIPFGVVDSIFSSTPTGGASDGFNINTLNGFSTTTSRECRVEGNGVAASADFKNNGSAGSINSQKYQPNTKQGLNVTATVINSTIPSRLGTFTDGVFFGEVCIYEIVMTNNTVTTTDREKMEGYFAWKWGTELKLPYNHTYLTDSAFFGYSYTSWYPTNDSGLVAWYDTADITKTTEVGGDVSQIDDKSGNGFNLTQGTGSQQPDNNSSLGNHKTFNYDGGDALTGSITLPTSGNVMFAMGAGVGTVNDSQDSLFSFDATTQDFQFDAFNSAQFDGRVNMAASSSFTLTGGPYNSATDIFVLVFDFTNTTTKAYVNGTQVGSTTDYSVKLDTSGTFILMANRALNQALAGAHGDVIITESIAKTDREYVEGFLANKYGVEGQLPVTHPFYDNTPRIQNYLLTEGGDIITTEDGDRLILE